MRELLAETWIMPRSWGRVPEPPVRIFCLYLKWPRTCLRGTFFLMSLNPVEARTKWEEIRTSLHFQSNIDELYRFPVILHHIRWIREESQRNVATGTRHKPDGPYAYSPRAHPTFTTGSNVRKYCSAVQNGLSILCSNRSNVSQKSQEFWTRIHWLW